MKKYRISTIEKHPEYALLTISPRGVNDIFNFEPGQYAAIGFVKNGRPSPMRCFSFVNAPQKNGQLQFAMRMEGAFTQTISDLQRGDIVMVQGPFGNFVVDHSFDKNVVFLAGGIGITPFISMLRDIPSRNLQIPITLLYSCRSFNQIPFYAEIEELRTKLPYLNVVYAVKDGSGVKLSNCVVPGVITSELLDSVLGGQFTNQTYFLCGPKGFMTVLSNFIAAQGVEQTRIISESFSQAAKVKGSFNWSPSKLTFALTGLAMLITAGAVMTTDLLKNSSPTTAAKTITPASNQAAESTDDSSSSNDDTGPTNTTTPPNTGSNNSASTSTPSYSTPSTSTYRTPSSSVS